MGLPLAQHRALRKIERRLRGRDGGLTDQFALFTRLAEHEPLPEHEHLGWSWRRRHPV